MNCWEKFWAKVCPNGSGGNPPSSTKALQQLEKVIREIMDQGDCNQDFFKKFTKYSAHRPNGEDQDKEIMQYAKKMIQSYHYECAWALSGLLYDQVQKIERRTQSRINDPSIHRGSALDDMATTAIAMGSKTLAYHYAQLACIADLLIEKIANRVEWGRHARTLLEIEESSQYRARREAKVRRWIRTADLKNKDFPIYPEAMWAADWFPEGHKRYLLKIAKVGRKDISFVEVLLREIGRKPINNDRRGRLYEALVALLISATPGFRIGPSRRDSDEQIDLTFNLVDDPLSPGYLPKGPGLIECKASSKPVGAKELRDFAGKCRWHRVNVGILACRTGLTGGKDWKAAEFVRRSLLADGLTILVLNTNKACYKDASPKNGYSNVHRSLRGVQDELKADYETLVFGPAENAEAEGPIGRKKKTKSSRNS